MIARNLHLIWTFYKKLIIPSVLVTIIASFFLKPPGTADIQVNFVQLGLAYIFISLIFQLIIYEFRNPNEYYFYYNFGLEKRHLWLSNLVIGIIIGILLIFIEAII